MTAAQTPGWTPGLWGIQEPMDEGLWIVEAGKEAYEWRVIASCPWPDEPGDIPRNRVKANARLIAAAPDMATAAIALLEVLDASSISKRDFYHERTALRRALAAAGVK